MTIQRLVFVTKIRSATLATKINKNQGLVLKTIGVNFVVNYGQFKIYLLFCPYECNALHWWAKQNKIFILGVQNPLCRERGWCVSAQAIGDRL